jgi:hypothetical protein
MLKCDCEPDLLDVAVLVSLVVLATQYFLNFFMLPWLKKHTGPETYEGVVSLIRGLVAAFLVAAVAMSVVELV